MKPYHSLLIVFAAFVLSACSDDPETTTTEIPVATISGNQHNLSGTYKRDCNAFFGTSNQEKLVVDSIVLAYYYQEWNSNTTCSGQADTTKIKASTINLTTSPAAITGWSDADGNPSVAPMASDGSGALSDTESVSLLNVTINFSDFGDVIGTTGNAFYVVDDSATPILIYPDVYADVALDATDTPYVKQ